MKIWHSFQGNYKTIIAVKMRFITVKLKAYYLILPLYECYNNAVIECFLNVIAEYKTNW